MHSENYLTKLSQGTFGKLVSEISQHSAENVLNMDSDRLAKANNHFISEALGLDAEFDFHEPSYFGSFICRIFSIYRILIELPDFHQELTEIGNLDFGKQNRNFEKIIFAYLQEMYVFQERLKKLVLDVSNLGDTFHGNNDLFTKKNKMSAGVFAIIKPLKPIVDLRNTYVHHWDDTFPELERLSKLEQLIQLSMYDGDPEISLQLRNEHGVLLDELISNYSSKIEKNSYTSIEIANNLILYIEPKLTQAFR